MAAGAEVTVEPADLIETSTASFALPDASWEDRFATHNSFTVPAVDGQRPLISGNVAIEEGGGLHLTDSAEAHLFEVDFSGNVALGSASAGGAAHCGTFTTLKCFGCFFVNNSAPNGRGGAVHTSAEAVVEILHSTALQNTAKSAGGFGSFESSATVKISNTIMESNRLQGGAGGAVGLYGVRDATITKSGFFKNSVAGLGGAGGAVGVWESLVKFEGVQFAQNIAANGDGGAVAIFSAWVSWSNDAETCSLADVVVDFSTTTEHCGQYQSSVDTCDNFASECASVNLENPFVTDRSVPYCTIISGVVNRLT
jgi:hypothetical protein